MVSINIEDEYARFNELNDSDLTKVMNESQEYQRKFLTSSSINTNDIWPTAGIKPGTGFRPSTRFRGPETPHRPGTGIRPASNLRTGTGMRLNTSIRLGTGYRPGTGFRSITNDDLTRPMTGYGDGMNRPMTAVKGAGYTSHGRKPSDVLISRTSEEGVSNSEFPLEESPEVKLRNMENNIMNLIVSSITANSSGELQKSLTLAKEASTKERSLIRLQEQAGLNDSHNMDVTFSVIFNLANQYSSNELYTEAVKTYQLITKNRMFPNSNRLKINMGIIYYKLGYFQKSIKMFKMALDQVPTTQKDLSYHCQAFVSFLKYNEMIKSTNNLSNVEINHDNDDVSMKVMLKIRTKILHNIGILLIKVAKYEDACINFEYIMTEQPDFKAGLHLLLCYFALGNKDKMKRAFTLLLDVQLNMDEEDKFVAANMDDIKNDILHKVIENDRLSMYEKQLHNEAENTVLTAAKLIAPVIEDTVSSGYDWCIEAVRVSNYSPLAGNLEINKAIMFLKNRDLQLAIDTLKGFEKQENKVAGAAAANLSFIYYLQKDLINAEKYAQLAIDSDDYRGYGLINMGCVELAKDNRTKAKELFMSASEIDQSSVEALYNLGLLHKQDGNLEESLECFNQVNSFVPLTPWVLYISGQVLRQNNDPDAAAEMFNEALGTCPGAPGLLTALADVQEKLREPQIAFNYYSEAFRYYPSDFNVINWLGSYFINLHVAEKALYYFERAAKLQPSDPKWKLMVASCYRQSGNLHNALKIYEEIHKMFPENEDCLRYLIRICTDLGLKQSNDYSVELKRLEKSKEVRERIGSSRPGTSRPGTSRPTSRRSGSGLSSRSGSGQNAGRRSPQILRLSAGASSKQLPRISSANTEELRSNSFQSQGSIDASYIDPLGPMESRPRTSAGKPPEDDFADEELGDDLLPE